MLVAQHGVCYVCIGLWVGSLGCVCWLEYVSVGIGVCISVSLFVCQNVYPLLHTSLYDTVTENAGLMNQTITVKNSRSFTELRKLP